MPLFSPKVPTRLGSSLLTLLTASALIGLPSISMVTPPPTEASFRGYNGNVAFLTTRNGAGSYEVYAMKADGSAETNLTNNARIDMNPRWSPDGSRIAYNSLHGADYEIYIMDADGSNQTRLTNVAGADFNIQWSPDGSKIAFESNRDGNFEIYVMNADGSNQTRLTNATGSDSSSGWSSDGGKITFASRRDGNTEIYIMEPDGSNQTRLTNNAATDEYPLLSMNNHIVFSSNRDGNIELYSMESDGSNLTRLTNTASFNESSGYAKWSPDGQALAFIRKTLDGSGATLVLLNIDDLTEQEFDYSGNNVVNIGDIRYSPDGSRILLTSYHGSTYAEYYNYVVNADGSNLVRLTNDGKSGYGDWQPIPNTAPVLDSKSLTTSYQTAASVDVLADSTDEEDLEGSSISISAQPNHGTAAVNTTLGKINYTPDDGFSGSDSLTYEICDSFMLDQKCSTAVLGITVAAPGAPTLTLSKVDGQAVFPGGSYSSTTNKPTFTGAASPLADIRVEIHSDPIILTTQADSQGNWSVTATEPLPPGHHTVTISATLNGQTTTLDSFVLGIQDIQGTIPDTGADSTAFRTIGFWALAIGGWLGLYQRRSYRRQQPRMPRLFP